MLQHDHLVAHQVDHRQVVADEQVGHAETVLQVLHQVQHLGLHRHVERADRLVGDDQLRPRDQRARDRDALALAAAEFMRVLVEVAAAQAHRVQHLGGAFALLGARRAMQNGQRLGYRLQHACAAGPGCRRGPGTPSGSRARARRSASAVQLLQVLAVEQHLAAGGRLQRHHQPRQRALARPRFTDDAQAAPALQGEADAGQRLHHRARGQQLLARQAVAFVQLDGLQQDLAQASLQRMQRTS